jgi:CheY-like chemotaxis protein
VSLSPRAADDSGPWTRHWHGKSLQIARCGYSCRLFQFLYFLLNCSGFRRPCRKISLMRALKKARKYDVRSNVRQILVADGDCDIRDLLSGALLSDCACHMATASDSREALRFLETFRPTLVISDTAMPRMDGIRLAGHVIARGIPFVLTTGGPLLQQYLRAIKWPHLGKPFRLSELRSLASETLAEAQANLRCVGSALDRLCPDNREARRLREHLQKGHHFGLGRAE